jgi:hypothetical protein
MTQKSDVHEFFPQRQFNNMLISMPGSDFNVAGLRSTYNLVQTKIGAQLNLNEKLALFTDFQGEFSPVSQSYGGKIYSKKNPAISDWASLSILLLID